MHTRLLSEAEFKGTFAMPMRDVLASATDVLDIWPYVAAVPSAELGGSVVVPDCVEYVYRNATDTFDHVLVVTNTKNVYLVVVVDLVRDAIFGHRLLDLNHEYGLSTRSGPSSVQAASPNATSTAESRPVWIVIGFLIVLIPLLAFTGLLIWGALSMGGGSGMNGG